MLEFHKGDLLKAPVDALVNTVNTVGVMGKGIALQFKRAFEDNNRAYEAACKRGEVQVGKMFVFERNALDQPHYIINFPTKKHWRNPSKLEYVEAGLVDLVRVVRELNIRSLALPALGAGSGKLDWALVRPLIERAFAPLPEVRVMVFEPQTEVSHELTPQTKRPALNPNRAAFLRAVASYGALGDTFGRLQAQKLAYFLQAAGLNLKLEFERNEYGPYAEKLNFLLQHLEGHYIKGYGDRLNRSAMYLLPGVLDEVVAFLADYPGADEAAHKAAQIIEGFETPYGLELLATVHLVVHQEGADTWPQVLEAVHGWSERKRNFPEQHIRMAWEHLTRMQPASV